MGPPNLKTRGDPKGRPSMLLQSEVDDDRKQIQAGDQVLLIVEDEVSFAHMLLTRAHEKGFKGIVALNAESGITLAQKFKPDVITLDLDLPEINGLAVLDLLKHDPNTRHIPVYIISTVEERQLALKMGALDYLQKPVTNEILNQLFSKIDFSQDKDKDQNSHSQAAKAEKAEDVEILVEKKVLIVDDDTRNIFAVMNLLASHNMQVLHAENGKDGLELLKNTPGIDVVLMDIMMPELDGYETMRLIRQVDKFKSLPIIALTAKAMKGDREKCLEAGASDYIPKPVDSEQLLSLLRVWLYKNNGQ